MAIITALSSAPYIHCSKYVTAVVMQTENMLILVPQDVGFKVIEHPNIKTMLRLKVIEIHGIPFTAPIALESATSIEIPSRRLAIAAHVQRPYVFNHNRMVGPFTQ